jgi:hypothetical protein
MRASAPTSSRGVLCDLGNQTRTAAARSLRRAACSAARPAMRSRGASNGSPPDSRGASGIQQHFSQVHPRHPSIAALGQADDSRGAAGVATTTSDETSTSKGAMDVDLESRAASTGKGTSTGFKILGLDPSPELVAISMGACVCGNALVGCFCPGTQRCCCTPLEVVHHV